MRILLLNESLYGIEPAPGETWSYLQVQTWKGNLVADTSDDLIDYDIFIVDLDKTGTGGGDATQRHVSNEIVERVEAGGCLICFVGTKNAPWLPMQFNPRGTKGERVTIEQGDDRIVALLEKYAPDITYKTQLERGSGWTPMLTAMNGYPVAGYGRHGTGLVLVLPQFKRPNVVVRDFLDNVIPAILPHLVSGQPVIMEEAEPAWLSEFPIAEAQLIEHDINAKQQRIREMQEELENLDHQKRLLTEFQGLLWYEGKPLERIVERALNLLGIDAHPVGQVDLVYPLPRGEQLYIEIEGTGGAIQVRKGSQLLRYVSEADDPSTIHGAIIGNPFRKETPTNRPPSGSQVGLFSPPMERLAHSQKWKLVTTAQVFEWIKIHYAGDPDVASQQAKDALGVSL